MLLGWAQISEQSSRLRFLSSAVRPAALLGNLYSAKQRRRPGCAASVYVNSVGGCWVSEEFEICLRIDPTSIFDVLR
jgi:hypothetical protein